MRTEIQQLQSELDVTTIYVTHDQTEAMTMGDRIAIMNGGELQQVATPLEAYYSPENTFVAGFIGSPSMNFLTVSVDASDEGVTLEHGGFTLETSKAFGANWAPGRDEVTIGVRPEAIEVGSGESSEGIPATIDVVEPLGKEQLLYFSLDGETYVASVEGHRLFGEGDTVQMLFHEERLHVFDADTGESIRTREPPSEDQEVVARLDA
jgi:multiple sugar transport system ATP-binding protein